MNSDWKRSRNNGFSSAEGFIPWMTVISYVTNFTVSLVFASNSLNYINAFYFDSVIRVDGLTLTNKLTFLSPTLAGGKFS